MSERKLIVNLGLARCGTTATETYFRDLPNFSTPVGVKELKYFLRGQNPAEYLTYFNPDSGSILFESSPPYMHSGLDTFRLVIQRIAHLRDCGFDVHLLVNIRNLLKRAFSHYWHDINGHYAIFGRFWGVTKLDDPRRFGGIYTSSFVSELTASEAQNKFLPDIGTMLQHAVAVMGADRVRLVLTTKLDDGIDAFLQEILPGHDLPPTKTRRIPGARAPIYLYGGQDGATFEADVKDGTEQVYVPAHSCVLFARRHRELLSATTFDLERVTAAATKWTRSLDAAAIPQNVLSYLSEQRTMLAEIPEECFLAQSRDTALDEIFSVPANLSVKETRPDAETVKSLVWNRQVSDAERDGKVMVGRSGRLFLHHDMNKVLAQHSGELVLPPGDVAAWVTTLDSRARRCADLGLRYQMLIAPDTHAVYREDIPMLDDVTATRPIQQVLSAYTGNNLVYPLAEMRAARSLGEVCHETDSHWSAFGAFVAYRALLQQLGPDFVVPDYADVKLVDRNLVGDLGVKFDPPRAGRTTDVALPQQSKKVWNNGVVNRGHMSLWVGEKRDLPSALLLTDSYGWKFQVFLAQNFRSLFVVHTPVFEPEAIARFRPDVVVSLMAERFMYKVPDDTKDRKAIQHAVEKVPGSAYPDFSAWPV